MAQGPAKFVQIALREGNVHGYKDSMSQCGLFALDQDGGIWWFSSVTNLWYQIPPDRDGIGTEIA